MRLKQYINEASFPSWITSSFIKIKKELENLTIQQLKKKCENAFNEIRGDLDHEKLVYLMKRMGLSVNEEIILSEDIKHWWDLIKTEAFPTLAFYPALQVWLELDKILKGSDYSGKVIGFYAALWLVLISGKYMAGYLKWKKEKPDEYEMEKLAKLIKPQAG